MQPVSSNEPSSGDAEHWEPGIAGGVLILVCLLGVIILVPTAIYLGWLRATEQHVNEQLAELRAQDQPTTLEELDAFYAHPPEDEDATPLLLPAIQKIGSPEFQAAAHDLPIVGMAEREIPAPGQPWQDLEAARELLDLYAGSLRQLHQAADAGGAARFPLDFDDGFGMSLEHIQRLRAAIRLLSLEAHVRAAEGDAAGTAQSVRALLSLARSSENEPLMVSQLVSYACHGVAYRLIDDLLPHVNFSDEDLAMLQREVRRTDFAEGARRALAGERVLGMDAIRHPEKLGQKQRPAIASGVWTNRDLGFYIEIMNRFADAAEKPWPEAQHFAEKIEEEMKQQRRGSPDQQRQYTSPRTILPAAASMLAAGANVEAARRVTESAIAVERYRRDEGKSPRSLGALVPNYLPVIPTDPFDGQPLRYRFNDGGITIYSIGRDDIDNSGQGDIDGNPDVVIQLPRR